MYSLSLVRRKNSEFKAVVSCLTIELVSHPVYVSLIYHLKNQHQMKTKFSYTHLFIHASQSAVNSESTLSYLSSTYTLSLILSTVYRYKSLSLSLYIYIYIYTSSQRYLSTLKFFLFLILKGLFLMKQLSITKIFIH